ncbi:MAG TPA: glycine oxidase ThiO [Candidatus Baltobacteraceae bacterium]
MNAASKLAGDVAIIGAGLIGLSIAFELTQRGAAVRVYDTREPAKAASWAGAGMLAPWTEAIADAPLQALCEESLGRYPEFVERVRAASGVDPHLRLEGIASAAFSSADLRGLEERALELRAAGRDCEIYDREGTLALEPILGKHVRGSLLVRGEGEIDNRRLGRALAAACTAGGAIVRTGLQSVAVEADGRRVLGVRSDEGFAPAGAVINAAGAWASQITGVPAACTPPVRPVKGQMLALAIPRGLVGRAIWVPGGYLVPREDGRLLVGATVEERGFDTRVTAQAIHDLLHAAVAAAPALGDFAVSEMWAGLRPGSPDGRPFIGPTALAGYFLAVGHYRNGILLAPATAARLADIVEGRSDETDAAFGLARMERPDRVERDILKA